MKKIITLLAFFAMLYSADPIYGQSTIFVRAPDYYKTIGSSFPIELFVQPYTNGCYLITAPELAALTGTDITSFGIHLFYGNGTSVASGSMSVYLQNTSDVSYSKGNSFSSCIAGMSNVYSGNTSIAATTGTTDVTCGFTSPFTYTGGGLYVAFSWSAGVSSTPKVLYSYGAGASSFGVIKGQISPTSALNSMTTTAYRPTFVFGITNTATNEAGVELLLAPGKVAEALHMPQIVQANIRNRSINTLNNLQVWLNISGANSFSDLQVIPSISAGAVTTVSFLPYSTTALGNSTMEVTIPPDQNSANNSLNWTQNVTCNHAGYGPPGNGYYEPVGYQGILAGKFNFDAPSTMGSVRLAISSTGINDIVYGVLLDQNGTFIAYTNTLQVISGMIGTFQNFTFSPPRILLANTNYYIGMAIPNPNLSTMGCRRFTDGVPGNKFGILPLSGGTFSVGKPAYYGIEPVLSGSITVVPASSVICIGEEIVLTPIGANSYTWSNALGGYLPAQANGGLAVMPTNDTYYGLKTIDAAGCTGQGTKSLTVVECTGITKLTDGTEISLYPNPTFDGKTDLHGLQGMNTITIHNMFGQEVLKTTSAETTVSIHIKSLGPGNYLVKITDKNLQSTFKKLIHLE